MMESITLQLLDMEISKCKKEDLQKKLNIAVNIVKNCERNTDEIKPIYNLADVSNLTGVKSETLEKVKKLEVTNIKFNEWLIQKEIVYNDAIYNRIRTYLLDLYTQTHEIPTKQRLENIIKNAECVTPQTERYLGKFFTSIKLPGTDVSILVEKPEIIMKRFQYLHTKLMYHTEGRNVVYIGSSSLSMQRGMLRINRYNSNNSKFFLIAASPNCGYISSTFFRRTDETPAKYWIMDKVIPVLPSQSVVILSDNIWCQNKDPPSAHALKSEMINWLLDKGIPHDPKTHRAELFLLIENYKKTCRAEATRIENIITAKGHIVLQRPKEAEFSFFDLFWTQLANTAVRSENTKAGNVIPAFRYNLSHRANSIASSLSVKYWRGLEIELLNKEQKAYKADFEMEEVIDKLMTFAKHERLDKRFTRHLDPYCKAMDKEYIFNVKQTSGV